MSIIRLATSRLARFLIAPSSTERLMGRFTAVLNKLSSRGDFFITYRERPKYASAFTPIPPTKDFVEFAIVLQGPLITKDNFTLATVQL